MAPAANWRTSSVPGRGGIGLGPASDRVIDLLRDEGFTGWDTFPVEVYLKDGSRLLGYQGLIVTGKCGALDPAASEPYACDGILHSCGLTTK